MSPAFKIVQSFVFMYDCLVENPVELVYANRLFRRVQPQL